MVLVGRTGGRKGDRLRGLIPSKAHYKRDKGGGSA